MTGNDTLVAFTLLVTIITVLKQFQIDLRQQLFRAEKAQQRIIASYGMTDPAQRIALLKSAIDADPDSQVDTVLPSLMQAHNSDRKAYRI